MSKNYLPPVLKNSFVALVLLLGHVALAQTVQTFNTPGTGTFTVPAGVTEITVEAWGGGGRGGSRTSGSGQYGGGGGGAYSRQVIAVTPGQAINYTVGAGSSGTGPGGASGAILNGNVFVAAAGGNSVPNNGTSGATGGAASAGIGDVRFSGGNGSNSFGGDNGGGGGSSAGTAANGNSVVNSSVGATAPAGGGNGGNGVTSGSNNGGNGQAPGGGGGGARRRTLGGSPSGGTGGNGRVRLTYDVNIDNTVDASLEFAAGDGNPSTTNGPTQSTSIRFRNNTNNPVGNTFETYNPEVRADFQLTNQQYTNSTQNSNGNAGDPNNPGAAIGFIYGSNEGESVFPLMTLLGSTASTEYTSTDINSGGIGIDPTANRAVIISEGVGVLNGQARSGRYHMHDVVVSFNQPLSNPVLHLVGLGGNGGGFGFSAELELLTSGVSLARLSGTSNFVVQGNQILNPAAVPNGGDDGENGSVLIAGENITELTFRVFVRGQSGATGTAWGNTFEDAFKMAFSTRVSDLSVDIAVDNDTPNFGDTITFTIDAANLGASTNTGVEIAALLPPGLEFVNATPSFGSYDPTTGIWTIPGGAPAGASASLTIQAEVTSRNTALMVMTAEISGDLADPDRSNNIARSFIQRFPDTDGDGVPDLFDEDSDNDGILDIDEKVANPFSISGGNPFTLNNIPSIGAGDEIVIDFTSLDNSFSLNFNGQDINLNGRDFQYQIAGVPATDNFVRFVSDDCQHEACGIPTIWSQEAEPLIRVIINSDGLVTFLGRRTPSDPLELMYPIDGFNQVTWQENNTLIIGQELVGATNAAGTVYYAKDTDGDGVPDHLDLDSDGDGCPDANEYYDDPTADADGNGTFGSGSPAVDSNGRVTAADYNGTGLAAVVDDEVNTGCRNDLAISMEINDEFPVVGDTVTFTLTAENLGVGRNFDVSVAALLPDGYTFVSSNPSIGTYNAVTGVWTITGEFDEDALETLEIVAVVNPDALDYNFETSIEGRFPDTNLANNEANLDITPRCGSLQSSSQDLMPFGTSGSSPFVTTWDTTNSGSSGNNQITIPTQGAGYSYNVFWFNVNNTTLRGQDVGLTGDVTITFPEPGIYQVEICGDFPRIYFNNEGDRNKILSVEQWGDKEWTSMEGAFFGASNLVINAADTPDLSLVTNMNEIFRGATSLNQDLNNWDVSNVTMMEGAFRGATSFNQPLNNWDVSSVVNMASMFSGASVFNQYIGDWNTSEVDTFASMFNNATAFNQDLSQKVVNEGTPEEYVAWDTSRASNFTSMFQNATAFNQDIGNWDISSGTTFLNTFNNASAFNQSLADWDISNMTIAIGMLNNSGLNLENYDATLNAWGAQTVNPNVTVGAQGLTFCYGDLGRDELINNNGWTFVGDTSCEFVFETDGDWETANRWLDNRIPEPRHTARVIANLDVIAIEEITNLVVESTGSVTIANNQELRVRGDLQNDGGFFGEGKLMLDGNNLQTISGSGRFEKIVLDNPNDAVLTDPVDIFTSLEITSGDFISNGNATFRCGFDSTTGLNTKAAIIGQLSGNVIGNVTTEQCYPGRRAFRFVSPSVTTTTSIRANWQEGATAWNDNPNPGYGTHITGLGVQNSTPTNDGQNGFDWQPSGNPSMFVWNNATTQWSAINNTDSNTLTAGQVLRLNIRGSRAVDLRFNTSATSNTILRETGNVERGTVTFTTSDLGLEGVELQENDLILVGNPFQSIVDLHQVIASSTGVKPFVAIWDPRLGGVASNVNQNSTELGGRGSYLLVSTENGATNNPTSAMNQFLQPKQALFFYKDDTGAPVNIVFEEFHKIVDVEETTTVFSNLGSHIQLSLFDQASFDANDTADDGIKIMFNPMGNNLIDQKDVMKLSNQDENLARMFGNQLIGIEERNMPEHNEVLPLFINNYRKTDYVFTASNIDLPADTKAYLRDNYLDTFTELEPGQTVIPFSIDNNINASKAFNRFAIVFEVETFSIQDFDKAGFALYPNPVISNEAWISASSLVGEKVNVRIYDVLGRKVASFREEVGANGQIHLTNLSGSAGVYMVELTTTDKKFTTKYIKK